ncbi:serine/threonine-protein kinase [uncultured Desulfosarcina sp.]|uniref:serine/threonine-protein kinase n=1 Tax=uncultured Desulfosarcina sp. TaxID=218289 RepID=UPI0029C991A9|nr:serine/threonine-protein kinase [uncultured Desulfosarcina sp.]
MKYGRYEIVKELGRGTMGVVYKAHDPQIERMVALKVLRPDRVVSQDFVLRFLREAKAIGRISHPNIVTVYDVGQDHGTIYIAMEYLEGRPLNEVIKGRTVPVDETVGMCVQVAEALGYAHRQGITHRDIKPSNIILTPDNRIKLTDFGIARIEDPDAAQQTQAGDILGTPVYMAPEQVMGQKADGRTDLYALGVIAYEMVVGKRPFGGGNIAAIFRSITHEPPEDPMNRGSLGNRALADLILKSLSKDPANRFQTGEAMATALKRCLDAADHPFPEPATPGQKASTSKKMGLAIGIFCLCLVAGIVGYAVIHNPSESTRINSAAVPAVPVPSSILNVTSTPEGAQVFVDSIFKGITPVDIPMVPGRYEVRLNLPDYYEWEAQLQIDEKNPTPLNVRLISIN